MDVTRRLQCTNNQSVQTKGASSVKHCPDIFVFSFVWLNGEVGHETMFIRELKQRMLDCYTQNWHARLLNSNRYNSYRSLKHHYNQKNTYWILLLVDFETFL
eukprot:TRINITY_DN71739_c1_g1_i1.p1 TRINITY_DN71739_c1_g1~~TRINITY_DN71739_c1_g1_i1.p1  ORF type:complete len:102 (+),score=2.25 TRINITY_DN71739_c1_g1_i1:3-308(+)